jgi:uncharacterized membrane protein YjfL (UPF0719 family)
MKKGLLGFAPIFCLLASISRGSEAMPVSSGWHAPGLLHAIGSVAVFSLLGIALAILGYKLFDKCTPGDLHREIVENKNAAAAIVAAAVILGVCLIVAAAIVG